MKLLPGSAAFSQTNPPGNSSLNPPDMVIRCRRRDLGRVTAQGLAMLRQQLDQRLIDVGDQAVVDAIPIRIDSTLFVTEKTCP